MKPFTLRPHRPPRAAALGGTAAAAAAGFAALAAAAARRTTSRADHRVERKAHLRATHPVRRVAEALAPLGKWWTYLPVALGTAVVVLAAPAPRRHRRRRVAGAGAIVTAALAAAALGPAFDRWLPQPPPPRGRANRRKPVFPSGHALGPTAVAAAAGWVLTREEILPPAVAAGLLAYPALTVGGKFVGQRHWASDVAGGLLGGLAVAASCLALAELAGD